MGGDDINRQLMFLFTCQSGMKNMVTELSFSDIFLTVLHFAEKLPSVPMLELCCKQKGEHLHFTGWTFSIHEHHLYSHWPWNSLLVVWFWGFLRVSEGWRRFGFPWLAPSRALLEQYCTQGYPELDRARRRPLYHHEAVVAGSCTILTYPLGLF